jgi:hypothetical protein
MIGQPASLAQTVLRRMNQESGGNPTIVNRSDINWQRGTPSVGLMQVIGPTYRAYKDGRRDVGPYSYGTSVDPLANILASDTLRAVERYGSLSAAYNKAGGYANGGTTPVGDPFWVGEQGPELMWSSREKYVSSAAQSREFAGTAGPLGGGGSSSSAPASFVWESVPRLGRVPRQGARRGAGRRRIDAAGQVEPRGGTTTMSTVTVVATVEASNVPPRVRLDVTDTGTPNLFATTVTRLNPDGSTSPVRTPDGNPLTLVTSGTDRVGTVYDYEADYGAPVSYSTAESPTVVSSPVTVPMPRRCGWSRRVCRRWRCPSNSRWAPPTRRSGTSGRACSGRWVGSSRSCRPTGGSARRRRVPSRSRSDTTLSSWQALRALLTVGDSVLLLNVPATQRSGHRHRVRVDRGHVRGPVRNRRIIQRRHRHAPGRRVAADQVVDRPVGGTQAARTLADLMTYSSLAALNAAYSNSWPPLQAGP